MSGTSEHHPPPGHPKINSWMLKGRICGRHLYEIISIPGQNRREQKLAKQGRISCHGDEIFGSGSVCACMCVRVSLCTCVCISVLADVCERAKV